MYKALKNLDNKNIFEKKLLFLLIIFILQTTINFIFNNKKNYVEIVNNSIQINNLNYNITNEYYFIETIKKIEKNCGSLILKIKKSKIENIFILLVLYPFLKNNSVILYKLKNIEDYNKLNYIFNIKKFKKILRINIKDINYLIEQIKNKIYYVWEIFPSLDLLKKIRYIINNYYNEFILEIFDNSLNLNMENYIKKNKNDLNSDKIYNLMSKLKLLYNIN